MKLPGRSLGSVLVAGLWGTFWLATAWGQSDDATYLGPSALENERRTYNGTGNNVAQPEWGSVGQKQLRAVTVANYSDGVSTPPGDDRPTPREVLTEVFLSTPSSSSATSALFVGWGLLIGYDLFSNEDNASEPLDIACDNAPFVDVWCPLGSQSESIPFNRSRGEIDAEGGGTRSPINYATAYLDLDWIYGRDEDSATALRTLESGYLNLTAEELPHLLPDGTWLVADQRPTRMPVTFALMTLILREHNRCCDVYAPVWDAYTDEDAYQVCRQWTIAVFQHITENDFEIRLLGGSAKVLGAASYSIFYDDDNDTVDNRRRWRRRRRRRQRRLHTLENVARARYLAQTNGTYDLETNAGTDAVFSTVAIPAFYSALPSTVDLLDDNYDVIDEHGIELAMASADVAGLIERIGGIEPIIRGAAYSRTQAVDVSFMAEVSSSSLLFNLPVVAIQRGRDHGIPSYNDVRQSYGLSKVTRFENITPDATVQGLLEDAYGKVDLLDAYTGALAENEDGSGLFTGPLLRAVFLEQLYRAIVGDRHHHSHDTQNENAVLSTISDLIMNNSLISSIPLDAFTAPDMVAVSSCSSTEVAEVYLAEGFKISWNETAETGSDLMYITISARGIDAEGMIAIGFGGEGMTNTGDFVICVVSSETTAICTDHSATDSRSMPPYDVEGDAELKVVDVTLVGEWTHVTFARLGSGDDDSDYPLSDDIAAGDDTPVIYAWRSGEGIGKHPNSQRGDVLVNFADASTSSSCDDSTDYFCLHGALLLFVWMLIAPYGIYEARYRKGQKSLIGNLWWEMHEECMIICAEALLPLAITAIFTTGGPHNSQHAKWGFYMIGAIVLQIATGWARSRALLAKGSNFSLFHRVNKHFHIYAGWFAYMAGLVQCYRGLELVSGTDKLMFSAIDINFTMGNFEIVRSTLFPIWLAVVPVFFIALETRKQFHRFFAKGTASICGVVTIINKEFSDEALKKEVEDRLMPRTEELPLYTTQEFNDKILNGRTWVIVDAAVIDVSSFAKRHPGGARLIMNAIGTDITSEIIGEDASIGSSNMAFPPHPHTGTALEIARSLVVGYIEEEDDMDTDWSDEDEDGGVISSDTDLGSSDRQHRRRAHRRLSLSGSDSDSSERRASFCASQNNSYFARAPFREEQSIHSCRLAFWPDDDVDNSRRKSLDGRGTSVGSKPVESRGGGASGSGSGSDCVNEQGKSFITDSSNGQRKRQSKTPGGKQQKAPGSETAMGATVTLSAEAAAIVNASSPPPKTPSPTKAPARVDRRAAVGAEFGAGPRAGEFALPFVPVASASDASGSSRRPGRFSLARSMPFSRPVELGHPVERITTVSPTNKTGGIERKPKTNPVRRILGRIGSQIDVFSGTSGDESDTRQQDRSARAARRVREKKNQLDLFHVCPLLMHENMGDEAARPVYKFVFACPGRAGALVGAMTGVCHFHMRVAQEAGMTVVQRSYNAFAVRVQGGEGTKRKVVPASLSSEGELCIEMRIRIYPDGAMSNLLLQLVKTFDNPTVQLRGPFLWDRLIPPPAHRNVVMIAAGTGVNPMVQMIRDYLNPDSHTHGELLEAHSRLVLLWQNSVEEDLYCTDELTTLQAQAKGLLEVTALLSGDIARRNIPGNSFRRAKARLSKKRREAGLDSRGAGGTEGTGDNRRRARDQTSRSDIPSGTDERGVLKQEDESTLDDDEVIRDAPMRRPAFGRSLSRVTEEDCMSRENSFIPSNIGIGIKDVETGRGGGDVFRYSEALHEGMKEIKLTAEIGGSGRSNDVPLMPPHEGKAEDSVEDSGRRLEIWSDGKEEHGGSRRGEEAPRITGRVESANGPSVSALSNNCSTGVVAKREACGESGGDDACAFRSRGGGVEGHGKFCAPALSSQEAKIPLNDDASYMPSRALEDAKDDCHNSCKRDTRGGTGLVDTRRETSFLSVHALKRTDIENNSRQINESDGSNGSVKHSHVTKSLYRLSGGRSKRSTTEVAPYSPGKASKVETAVAGIDEGLNGGRPLRRQRQTATTLPSGSPVSSFVSSARPRRKPQSQHTARKKKRGSSRTRSSMRTTEPEALAGSPLDDSGSGLQHAKLSRSILQEAIGPDVMKATIKASAIAKTSPEGLAGTTDGSRSALSDLVGTESKGGTLQVVVSGPAGFVFHAEGLLAELGIPRQAVVLLD